MAFITAGTDSQQDRKRKRWVEFLKLGPQQLAKGLSQITTHHVFSLPTVKEARSGAALRLTIVRSQRRVLILSLQSKRGSRSPLDSFIFVVRAVVVAVVWLKHYDLAVPEC